MANLFSSRKLKATPLAVALGSAMFFASSSHATINPFSDDFEGLAVSAGDSALADLGWQIGASVFDGAGNFKFFFGLFAAPNGGAGFSSVATGDGHPGAVDDSGNYLNIFSDYNCCGLDGGSPEGHGNGTDVVNALVVKEYTISAADIGSSVTFRFDVKRPEFQDDGFGGDTSPAVGNGCGGTGDVCEASALVRTLDPTAGFSITNDLLIDTTSVAQDEWIEQSITLDLTDPLLEGQILQVGFQTFAQDFNNSGVYYDNVTLVVDEAAEPVAVPVPAIAAGALGLLLAGITRLRQRVKA